MSLKPDRTEFGNSGWCNYTKQNIKILIIIIMTKITDSYETDAFEKVKTN